MRARPVIEQRNNLRLYRRSWKTTASTTQAKSNGATDTRQSGGKSGGMSATTELGASFVAAFHASLCFMLRLDMHVDGDY